jgi:hypothetical protein
MDSDPRAKELSNLKLALATFALQLDAFEARLKSLLPLKITTVKAVRPAPDIGFAYKIVSAMKSTEPNGRPKSG